MDTEMITQQITGLKGKLSELREKEKILTKAWGIDEEAAKLRVEVDTLKDREGTLKDDVAKLVAQKNAAVAETGLALAKKMSQVLPIGSAVFCITETGNAFIGWNPPACATPIAYDGLSGGEKVMFDAALCHALDATVIIQEGAELDKLALLSSLYKASKLEAQVIVSTCHTPAEIAGGFNVIDLGGNDGT